MRKLFRLLCVTKVTLPESVTELHTSTFENCSSLSKAELRGVKTIGDRAFYNCAALSEISFSPSLKEIGAFAFSVNTSLEKLLCPQIPSLFQTKLFRAVRL